MSNQKTQKSGLFDKTYDVVKVICKLFLITEICITSMAVAGRYIPFIPDPAWSEEMTLTCMIYMAFISAALAIRRGAHIRMTSFDRYLPEKLVNGIDILDDILVLAFSAMLVIVGFPYCLKVGKTMYVSLPKLSKFWMYAPVPISGIAMIIFQTEILVKHIRSFCVKGAKKA